MRPRDPDIQAFREYLARTALEPGATLEDRRRSEDLWGDSIELPASTCVEPVDANGTSCSWFKPAGSDARHVVLYIHGGGFGAGSSKSHGHFIALLAQQAGAVALSIDYRRAPEHTFPAAVEDCVNSYQWLLSSGLSPESICVAGDSAGGGLTFSLALAARERGVPQPACLYAISPWADLIQSGKSHLYKSATDPMVTSAGLGRMAAAYLGGADAANPLASPILADLQGIAPMLVQVGSEEVLLSDALRLAEGAAMANVDATLEIWSEMVHVWPLFHNQLGAGRRALRSAAVWIAGRLKPCPS